MSSEALAFEQIYTAYRAKIYRFLVRMVGDYDAEDLTQEVFVRVSQALETFRGEAELSTWLYRIATNAAIDCLRSPSFHRIVQDCATNPTIDDEASEIDGMNAWTSEKAIMVEQQVYWQEMNECILNFVNSLPEAYRTVLVLSEFEDLSNSAIAEILGVSVNTVKIRLHRARARLKELLATHCGSEWIDGNEFLPELKRIVG